MRPSERPNISPELLIPGASVFHQPANLMNLIGIGQWWRFVPDANWRHPTGPDRMIPKNKWRICVFLGPALAVTTLPLLVNGGVAADTLDPTAPEQAKTIVADHIREQGYACDRAEEAHHDHASSKPDQPVWILRCSNAVYRVRLRGNISATVEMLDSQP